MADARGPAPFRLVALDHVVLRVRDPEVMTRFYTEALGCELVWRREALGLVHLRAGVALIDLLDINGPLGGGASSEDAGAGSLDHICLTISPFVEAELRQHLAGWGVTAGEVMERYGAQGQGLSFYLADPEGNRLELKAAAS